jgi:hypothetical protein
VLVDSITNDKGCIKVFPTFTQFLQFVLLTPGDQHNSHWRSYARNCSPCLLDYNAVVKLENADSDNEYVMEKSTLAKFAQLKSKHRNVHGKTEDVRNDYYSQVRLRS